MENLKATQELLEDHKESLITYQKKLRELPQKYIGNTLKIETEMVEKWIREESIYINALEEYIKSMTKEMEAPQENE